MTERDMLRRVRFEGYVLELWETDKPDRRGGLWLGYRLTHPDGRVLFEGEDFGASPMHSIDGDESLRGLLGFLTLKPGDTDAEYFGSYTPEQLAWCEAEAEAIQWWGMEASDDFQPLAFEEMEIPNGP